MKQRARSNSSSSRRVKSKTRSSKEIKTYKIPQAKLERALEFLHSKPTPARNHVRPCHGNIANRVGYNRKLDRSMFDTANLQEVASLCAEREQWPELMKTVAIMCEDPHYQDVHAILRNALFAIIADPTLNDPSYLEAYLYSNPVCKNPGDISYCIDMILEVFQGITVRLKRRYTVRDETPQITRYSTRSMQQSKDKTSEI
ncbi:uncharacterized protein LOC128735523 [Sabethes cyaneus]|uniref:uncharacterized protein LOC128735523 n=1 Tax=Sabethes cyaneus TaxID=53552 RepID=UPI00237DAE04|nr:uncharacterized protein LOC128735523 [Sabethes cyaneus]